MSAHSQIVVEKFSDLCQWAYDAWRTHRVLFDENPHKDKLWGSNLKDSLYRISVITQEYCLHQVAKLHDPALQNGQANLGIDYMIRFGGWDDTRKAKLQALQLKLQELLAKKIQPARNKILSHNDLEAILSQSNLGAFPNGADSEYFKTLAEFVTVIREDASSEPWNYLTEVDFENEVLVDALVK